MAAIPDGVQRFLEGMETRLRDKSRVGPVMMTSAEIRLILEYAKKQFAAESPLLELEPPINILGDIHGQFDDLLKWLKFCRHPAADNQYLFMGDYVDRGPLSMEVIILLLTFKLLQPGHFHLLRGNHEDAAINDTYGFRTEVLGRFPSDGEQLWKEFNDCFNWMPVAAVVGGKIFCCHGGLSPRLSDLNQINDIRRPTMVPMTGLLCDLLWADPSDDLKGFASSPRGTSVLFGAEVVDHFCRTTGIDLIVRAHQLEMKGYQCLFKDRLVTIFSAPAYPPYRRNDAAILKVHRDLSCRVEVLSLKGPPEEG